MTRPLFACLAALVLGVSCSLAWSATPEEQRRLQPDWIGQLAHPAQPLPASPEGPGVWAPWRANYYNEAPSVPAEWGLNARQLATFDRNLQSLVALLRKAPATREANAVRLWTPSGSMSGAKSSSDGVEARQLPVIGGIMIGAWPASKVKYDKQGRPHSSGETSHFMLTVNLIPTSRWMEDVQGSFFPLYRVPSPVPGTQALANQDDLLVIRPGRPDPYVGVSRERVIRAQIAKHDDADARVAGHLKAARERLERYLSAENAPKRQARIEEQAKYFRLRNPSMAEAEAIDRATAREMTIQRDLEAALDPPPTSPIYNSIRSRDALRAQLDGMSPEERAAPAWVSAAGIETDKPMRFVAPETSGAVPIVRENPDFFDKSLPRTSFQIAIVGRMNYLGQAAREDPNRAYLPYLANLLLVQQTDWAAFAAAMP